MTNTGLASSHFMQVVPIGGSFWSSWPQWVIDIRYVVFFFVQEKNEGNRARKAITKLVSWKEHNHVRYISFLGILLSFTAKSESITHVWYLSFKRVAFSQRVRDKGASVFLFPYQIAFLATIERLLYLLLDNLSELCSFLTYPFISKFPQKWHIYCACMSMIYSRVIWNIMPYVITFWIIVVVKFVNKYTLHK